ncbi:SDR family NAD(P)-dependent oxidoreductase [Terrihalobacillus insolitus]|uniref:SDR family NAD(P)-dependent oxidoreductase n=1 Tax=Terrihalobacillus insolitus TaxID=2950438 RepID=UPI002342397A|nr:glucose 1-dehydrogenase [Terrihalobacillus insolitus]MDC3415151.1 glucose 1-dehydrogenase [Terrihalobacillus insolitus]
MELKGKVSIVTGGAKGMGLGCVQKLASEGANVCIADLDLETAEKVSKAIKDEGGHAIAVKVNVANSEEVQHMVQEVIEAYGGIDILVNSAGVQRYGTVVETSEDLWEEVIDTNLKSMFLTAKYSIPHMKQRGGGSIVNISSVQAFATQKGVAAYTASKGGINALTQALAIDHAEDQIRVNAICPASVDTPMLRWAADLFKGEQTVEEVVSTWGKNHPLGRVGKIEEIAEYVSFLVGPRSSFITGTCNRIDGGLLAQSPVVLPED